MTTTGSRDRVPLRGVIDRSWPLLRTTMRRAMKLVALLPHGRYRAALRLGIAASVEHRHVAFAFQHRTVLDVGAGRGQFVLFALERFADARVICIEPGSRSFARLERVTRGTPRVERLHIAAGASVDSAALHLARDADSSSLLPIGDQARRFPGSDEVGKELVDVAPLDALLMGRAWERPALLKIDVQGGELAVLEGAQHSLDAIDEIFVEASFVELYTGQPLADEVIAHLLERGFRLAGVYPAATDRAEGLLQADLRFVRASTGSAPHA
jgi:FkbM family methyltransferase